MLAITVYALQRENTIHKALAGIVKKGTKAIKAWIEPTDWMRGLHRHMVPGEGVPHASCQYCKASMVHTSMWLGLHVHP